MKKNVYQIINTIVFLLFSGLTLTSCKESDEPAVSINIPAADEECCNAEETFLAYSLRDTIDGKYALGVYSRGGNLHAGYNDIYFALTKIANQGFVRDFSITEISPVMTMAAMGMKHATPTVTESVLYDATFPAVQHAWISFVMSSSDKGFWELSYKVTTQNHSVTHNGSVIYVNPNAAGQEWLKSVLFC